MRISLNRIKSIENYLLGLKSPGEALLFEVNMLLDNSLADDMRDQQHTYAIIEHYSRQKLKAEIAAVQKKLATAPQYRNFMQNIIDLFRNK